MKVLITGGAGDIGEYVVEEVKKNHKVVIVDIKESKKHEDVEFRKTDLLDSTATCKSISDVDVVIHLAAIPHPFSDPGDRVMSVNMVSSYNVLEAIRKNSIRRTIYGGSDSSTGFGIHNVLFKPLYLPLDTNHPCWPHESYCFSKYFGEIMFREYSRAYKIETISIRFMWVLLERNMKEIEQIRKGQGEWFNWLGSYVMPRDVAQIVSLAVDYKMDKSNIFPFEAFYVHAARTFLNVPTLKQAKRIWGQSPEIRRPEYYKSDPYAPFFDLTDSYKKLGYKPKYSVRNY